MRFRRPTPLGLMAGITVTFLIGPLLVVVLQSLTEGAVSSIATQGLSTKWYRELAQDSAQWTGPLRTSFLVALITVLAVVPVGVCAGIATARYLRRTKATVRLLFLMPLIVPTVITGMALLSALQGTRMLFSIGAVVAGHAVLTLPYALLLIDRHVSQTSEDPEWAARTLGAAGWQTFRRVSLPMLAPAVVTAVVLVFYNSWEEVVVTTFVSGTDTKTLPVAIFEATQNEVSPVLSALSTVLMVGTAVIALALVAARRRGPSTLRRALGNRDWTKDVDPESAGRS